MVLPDTSPLKTDFETSSFVGHFIFLNTPWGLTQMVSESASYLHLSPHGIGPILKNKIKNNYKCTQREKHIRAEIYTCMLYIKESKSIFCRFYKLPAMQQAHCFCLLLTVHMDTSNTQVQGILL